MTSGWRGDGATTAGAPETRFVNGTPLTQVMATGQLRPGTFFVSEGSNLIYMHPPAGTNVGSATVEAAVRRQTFNISGRKDIVVRGMVFRHAASCINTSGVNVSG